MARRDLGRRILALPVADKLRLIVRIMGDRRVPAVAKALLPGVLLYLASPLDVIPDFIPVIGQVDDLMVISAALALFLWLAPASVIEEHVAELE